jgi:hypothetical protein
MFNTKSSSDSIQNSQRALQGNLQTFQEEKEAFAPSLFVETGIEAVLEVLRERPYRFARRTIQCHQKASLQGEDSMQTSSRNIYSVCGGRPHDHTPLEQMADTGQLSVLSICLLHQGEVTLSRRIQESNLLAIMEWRRQAIHTVVFR